MNLYEAVIASQGQARPLSSTASRNSNKASPLTPELGRAFFEEVTPDLLRKSGAWFIQDESSKSESKAKRFAKRRSK